MPHCVEYFTAGCPAHECDTVASPCESFDLLAGGAIPNDLESGAGRPTLQKLDDALLFGKAANEQESSTAGDWVETGVKLVGEEVRRDRHLLTRHAGASVQVALEFCEHKEPVRTRNDGVCEGALATRPSWREGR